MRSQRCAARDAEESAPAAPDTHAPQATAVHYRSSARYSGLGTACFTCYQRTEYYIYYTIIIRVPNTIVRACVHDSILNELHPQRGLYSIKTQLWRRAVGIGKGVAAGHCRQLIPTAWTDSAVIKLTSSAALANKHDITIQLWRQAGDSPHMARGRRPVWRDQLPTAVSDITNCPMGQCHLDHLQTQLSLSR